MKRKLCIFFFVLIFIGTVLFAATDSKNFSLVAEVEALDAIKIIAMPSEGLPPSSGLIDPKGVFDSLDSFTEFSVTGDEAYGIVAYLVTLSNNRGGYTVSMKASAMESDNATGTKSYINYTVEAGDASVTTSNNPSATAATNSVVTKSSLSEVTIDSIAIEVTVLDYYKALSGSYAGTITFTYFAP